MSAEKVDDEIGFELEEYISNINKLCTIAFLEEIPNF